MEKLKMHSPDFTQENIAKLAELFPSCMTEAQDDSGNLKKAIDFDQLRQELSDHVVDGPRERYQLNWPGKRESLLAANAPIAKTLRPSRGQSVDFERTRNLFIEGDNLHALKLLQETYLSQVKMIYIDPPYNTGNDFVYDDDFSEDTASYFQRSSQTDHFGNRLVVNTEANGRFHSDWLSMMYSRLRLARNLLSDDGVIFISIDYRESANLRQLLNDVFGEDNMVFDVAVVNNLKGRNDREGIATCHEQLLIYRKPGYVPRGATLTAAQQAEYSETDENGRKFQWRDLRKRGGADTRRERPNMYFPLFVDPESGRVSAKPVAPYIIETYPSKSDGTEGCWRWGKEKAHANVDIMRGTQVRGTDRWNVSYRVYLGSDDGEDRRGTPKSIWTGPQFSSDSATKGLAAHFPGINAKKFTPKPVGLLQYIIDQSSSDGDIVMDFFAGSGSFVEAVFRQSASDGADRQFIVVQVPEPIDVELPAGLEHISTVADLCQERIRRAGMRVKEEAGLHGQNLDIGFRVLKIDTSNMKDVYYNPDTLNKDDLFDHIENIKEDRTPEDLLFQVLLDWGVDLSLPIAQENIDEKTVFFVDNNALAACFDTGVTEELVKKIATRKPLRVVFRDAGFSDDSVKINVEQIFKLISPDTEVKAI